MSKQAINFEPAWIKQARETHRLMVEQARSNDYGELAWEGKLTDIVRQTGASNSHYSRIINLLRALELVTFVQRGNRHQTSVLVIREKLWPSDAMPAEHLTAARHSATLVAEIEPQVKSLQAWRESLEKGGLDVAKVLQDFELRITRLEREVNRLGKTKT